MQVLKSQRETEREFEWSGVPPQQWLRKSHRDCAQERRVYPDRQLGCYYQKKGEWLPDSKNLEISATESKHNMLTKQPLVKRLFSWTIERLCLLLLLLLNENLFPYVFYPDINTNELCFVLRGDCMYVVRNSHNFHRKQKESIIPKEFQLLWELWFLTNKK